MKYRNTRTGAIINIESKLNGAEWELVKGADKTAPLVEETPEEDPTEPKKKGKRK